MSNAQPADEPPSPGAAAKRGLVLDRVVLLGRTLAEYERFFGFKISELGGMQVLDVAGGVSSFTAEASAAGVDARACDPIYTMPVEQIAEKCPRDLEEVFSRIQLPTYKWGCYRDPVQMRELRHRAYTTFLEDFREVAEARYVPGRLPELPFEARSFDVTLVSYLLFVYQEHFTYEFHRDAVLELMRVTRREARIYPLVTFEAERSIYVDRLMNDPAAAHLRFDEVRTDFEFLIGSNAYLRITHA